MRSLFIIFMAVLTFALMFSPAVMARDSRRVALLAATTLDDITTDITSSGIEVRRFQSFTVFVNYAETEVGETLSAVVTFEASYDNTTFTAMSFLDSAGGSTPQTTQTISADATYMAWNLINFHAPYIRIIITGANTDGDDTIDVSATLSGQK